MKIRLTAIIIILCILCAGCASETGQQEYWEHSDHGMHVFYHVENVMAFAKSDLAPEGFANHKCLKSIGEYGGYSWITAAFDYYACHLLDANMVKLYMVIDYRESYYLDIFADETVLSIDDANDSLMRLKSSENGIIVLDGITYRYRGGILDSVYWCVENVEFVLYMNDDFGSYPLDGKSTFITQITSLSEFKRTIAMKRFLWNYRLYS